MAPTGRIPSQSEAVQMLLQQRFVARQGTAPAPDQVRVDTMLAARQQRHKPHGKVKVAWMNCK
jgi:hypothetical protein